MESDKLLIFNFINKWYILEDNLLINKRTNHHEWGFEVIKLINNIFSVDYKESEKIIIEWCLDNNLNKSEIIDLLEPTIIKIYCIPTYDVTTLNVDQEIIKFLIEQITKELKITVLLDLSEHIKSNSELTSIIKCIGYESGPMVLDNDYSIKKRFIQVKRHVMKHEQDNNIIWQNYIKNK